MRISILILFLSLTACSSSEDVGVYLPTPDLAGLTLPDPGDPAFCQVIQQFLSSTDMLSDNTVFDTTDGYIQSKTSINPLTSYQYLTVIDEMPVAISCKIKGAAYIRAEYGEDKAGKQLFCPAATAVIVNQVASELTMAGDAEAAARAMALVIDDNQPVIGGPIYLADFDLSYRDPNGAVHLQSPSLFQDYEHWTHYILPDSFAGPLYCHLPTHQYVLALATGNEAPGLVMRMRE